jgi:hypothetical protein
MDDTEYYARLKLVWEFKGENNSYREKVWRGWADNFFPGMDLRDALKLFMDKHEATNVGWWKLYG